MRTKILMFGWEFPPHISGGLGTACFGLTKSLLREGVDLLFVVPKAHGDETMPLINASEIAVGRQRSSLQTTETREITLSEHWMKIETDVLLSPYGSRVGAYASEGISHWNYAVDAPLLTEVVTAGGKKYQFSGTYGPALLMEVAKYAEVAAVIAGDHAFDIIHAHDWLTFPAGMAAKRASGRPLIVHIHATEYDRADEKHVDPRVFAIEQEGMLEADRIVAVSHWTKDIIVSRYGINPDKIEVVHNGVTLAHQQACPGLPKIAENVVTFLGRITWQKGPQYFVEAAHKVLTYYPDTHFIMAGSGDLLPAMIELVARLQMSHRFHFTGFLKGAQIDQVWNVSNVYVMPSVSEPFGITPLEAVQAGVPVIVSNQSGVAEVIDHAFKVDFWDTDALANAIMAVLKHPPLAEALSHNGKQELESISWQKAARQLTTIYHEIQDHHTYAVH